MNKVEGINPFLASEVLFRNRKRCCVCRNPAEPVIVHRIDLAGYGPAADRLVVLCAGCASTWYAPAASPKRGHSIQELLDCKRQWESECDEWRSSPRYALRIRQGSTTIEEPNYDWLLIGSYGLREGEDLLIEMTSDELANIYVTGIESHCEDGYEFQTRFTAPIGGEYSLYVKRKSSEKTTVDLRVPQVWSSIERQRPFYSEWGPPSRPNVHDRPTSPDDQTTAATGPDRIPWEILPPGEHPFPRILEYCERLREKDQHRRIDSERLRLIEGLRPTSIYRGLAEFDGYFVFSFSELDMAILDCPVVGNAVYLIRGDWAELSRLTKAELLTEQSEKVTRVVHSGDWFLKVKMLIGIERVVLAKDAEVTSVLSNEV